MKTLFTTIAMAMATLVASAKEYTDQLVVTVNGTAMPAQETTVNVDQAEDGTYALQLSNLVLSAEGSVMPIGNIYLDGVEGSTINGITRFATGREINITAGDLEGVTMWMGPMLGPVYVDLEATMTDTRLYFHIFIDMTQTLGQYIEVEFGSPIYEPDVPEEMGSVHFDMLSVTVNGQALPEQMAELDMFKNDDGTYNIELGNLVLYMGQTPMPIGNVALSHVPVTSITTDGLTSLAAIDTITIEAGNMEGVTMWMGPMLGPVPVDLRGEIRSGKPYFVIDIDMASLQQSVSVTFGHGGYQLSNKGFEQFHTATYTSGDNSYSSQEPNAWHSFNSGVATGSMAALTAMALQNGSTAECSMVRPGTTGTKSVALTSSIVLGIQPANGTMTTGRMQAGSLSATDPANCAYLDMASTDRDGNGDPFYSAFNGQPDSLAVWVRFKQGTLSAANANYKYATVSAVMTDGTYYQDPEDKEYTNVAAKAQCSTIESHDFAWQRISIPFDYATYATNTAATKALLVTISTNAQPGVGSSDAANPDSLIVDDFELIYNMPELNAITINGQSVEGVASDIHEYELILPGSAASLHDDAIDTSNARHACVTSEVTTISDEAFDVTYTVLSCDLKKKATYTVHVMTQNHATGITSANTADNCGVVAMYNLSGQRVTSPIKGQVYVKKLANGKTIKAIAQ